MSRAVSRSLLFESGDRAFGIVGHVLCIPDEIGTAIHPARSKQSGQKSKHTDDSGGNPHMMPSNVRLIKSL
ncbi:MAG: hypothetical protein HY074_05470 [Deltaproteobacteria bacterium]|nr:hypothetical protein [Deltaproteobacteria bacterium]